MRVRVGVKAVRAALAVAVAVTGSLCLEAASHAASTPSVLTTYVGVPQRAGVATGGQAATRTRLETPAGLALDMAGNPLVADPGSNDVLQVVGGVAYVVAGSPGQRGTGTYADPAHLVSPTGLVVLADGTLLVADPGAHVVWQVPAQVGHPGTAEYQPSTVSVWAGTGRSAPAVDGAARTTTPFEAPTGLAVDTSGTVYVSDAADDTLWTVTTDGAVHHLAGASGQAGFAGDNGAASAVRLSDPTGLVWDADRLLVADTGNSRIRSVTAAGRTGTAAGPAGLSRPSGLAVDPTAGAVRVADPGTGRVSTLGGGTVTPYVGGGGNRFSPDGTAAGGATLDGPQALVVPARGRLLVSEAGASVVRVVGPAVTVPDEPDAPTVVVGNGRAQVSWTAPDNGGSPITSYLLREYDSPIPDAPLPVVGAQSIAVQGLTNGRPYVFTITAVNAAGDSIESPPSAVVVPEDPTATEQPTTAPTSSAPAGIGPTTSAPTAPASTAPVPAQTPAPVSSFRSTNDIAADGVPNAVVTPTVTAMPTVAVSVPSVRSAPAVVAPTGPGSAPTAAPSATTLAAPPAQLVPVHSFADAATDVATVGRKTAIPLVLVGLLVAFLLLQGVVDRRDATLTNAPVHTERGLEFREA